MAEQTLGDRDERLAANFDGTEFTECFPTSQGVSFRSKLGTAASRDVTTSDTDSGANKVYRTQDFPREEGTFTPFPTFGGSPPGGDIAYTSNGWYQRVGNTVFFTLDLTFTNKGTGDGNFRVEGLPFSANIPPANSVSLRFFNMEYTGQVFSNISGAFIVISQITSGGGFSQINYTDVTNTTNIRASGTYRI